MIRRLRIILPPTWLLVGCAVAFVTIEIPYWILMRWGAAPDPENYPSNLLIVAAALSYGLYRVAAFHPYFRPQYHEWLSRTPWTHEKPLPVGPVTWILEDALVIGGLSALTQLRGYLDPVVIATLPLMSYGILLTAALFPTGNVALGYATLFALGLAVWLGPNRWAFLGGAAGANLLAIVGFRRSLREFPWSFEWHDRWSSFVHGKARDDSPDSPCGWPYDALRPNLPDHPRIGLADAALVSLVAGWWVFAGCSLIRDEHDRAAALFMTLAAGTGFGTAGRVILYCAGHTAPISLAGRLLTFRWIIPGSDVVFVGPISALLAPILGIVLLRRWRVPLDIALPVCVSLTLFVALSSRPGLRQWRLTGRHRIVPTLQQKSSYVQAG